MPVNFPIFFWQVKSFRFEWWEISSGLEWWKTRDRRENAHVRTVEKTLTKRSKSVTKSVEVTQTVVQYICKICETPCIGQLRLSVEKKVFLQLFEIVSDWYLLENLSPAIIAGSLEQNVIKTLPENCGTSISFMWYFSPFRKGW